MPLGIGDGQLLPSLLLAIFGDVLAREDIAPLAPEGSEQLERFSPPSAFAFCISFVGLWGRHVQDARKLALVLLLHRA